MKINLNELAKSCGFDDIPRNAVEVSPFEDNETSVTVLFDKSEDSAFLLNNIKLPKIKEYNRPGVHQVPESYVGNVGVHRSAVSYMAGIRMVDEVSMKKAMAPIIEIAVKDLINQFGDISLPCYRVSMELPTGEYFRDMENSAAYEVRFILVKKN